MTTQWEWAGTGFDLVTPEELEELSEDGNDAGDYGLSFSTGSNGCMIVGSAEAMIEMALEVIRAVPLDPAIKRTRLLQAHNALPPAPEYVPAPTDTMRPRPRR